MTAEEFKNQFDVLYDIATLSAPGVTEYEKSVFLSTAQLKILDAHYLKMENSPLMPDLISNLIRHVSLTNIKDTSLIKNINKKSRYGIKSYLFKRPTNIYQIAYEQLNTSADIIEITEIGYSKVGKTLSNPFRADISSRAWRIIGQERSDSEYIEILYKGDIIDYIIRYVENPKPIITETLTDGFTIDGETGISNGSLNEISHDEILALAVELATTAYQENTLQNQVGINQ